MEREGFATHIRIGGYPTREYLGFIWVYLGEGEPPEFTRYPEWETAPFVSPQIDTRPCNWFQMVENSLDAVHVSFVHLAGKVGPFGEAVTNTIPSLEYLETSAGIRQIARRGAGFKALEELGHGTPCCYLRPLLPQLARHAP